MWKTAIWRLAAERGWADPELAERLQVHRSTIWRLKEGRIPPGPKVKANASLVFGAPVSALFWEEDAVTEAAS